LLFLPPLRYSCLQPSASGSSARIGAADAEIHPGKQTTVVKTIGNTALYFLALAVAAYAILAYALLPLGIGVHPAMRLTFHAHQVGIYTHVFASSLALLTGPFQFSSRLRQRSAQVHRWMGRIYLGIGVALGGLSGLYMATLAFGGLTAKLGFACLALAWLYTGLRAFGAVRAGDVAAHRRWMVRNFALTFAAVTLRIYLPISVASGIPFETCYPVIAWLCWIPNLLVAEALFNRASGPSPMREVRAQE
jgi:uncharacterized membrane protein